MIERVAAWLERASAEPAPRLRTLAAPVAVGGLADVLALAGAMAPDWRLPAALGALTLGALSMTLLWRAGR